jgi:2'-5' RNA ligase
MRVFIGVKASKKLQKKVGEWRRRHADLPVRWIKDRNLHLTLVPPWYEDDGAKAIEKLNSVQFKKHTITFDRVGINFKHKVIWIGKPTEHVTIARFKDAKPLSGIQFEEILWKETADTVTLFESRLRAKGADYYEIAKKVVRGESEN